jgi:hypothetical protein
MKRFFFIDSALSLGNRDSESLSENRLQLAGFD